MLGRAPRQSQAATELMELDKGRTAAPVPRNSVLARLAETSPTMASLPATADVSNQAVVRALAPARGPASEAAADRIADALVAPAAPASPVAADAVSTPADSYGARDGRGDQHYEVSVVDQRGRLRTALGSGRGSRTVGRRPHGGRP